MNSDFLSNYIDKQKLKFNVDKCKAIKAQYKNNKHEHFMNTFVPKQESCPAPPQKRQKDCEYSFKYVKAI